MPVNGVPKNRVGQVVQDYVDNGESVVTATQEGSGGTYTVAEGGARALTRGLNRSPATTGRPVAFLDHEAKNHKRHASKSKRRKGN